MRVSKQSTSRFSKEERLGGKYPIVVEDRGNASGPVGRRRCARFIWRQEELESSYMEVEEWWRNIEDDAFEFMTSVSVSEPDKRVKEVVRELK